MKHIVVLGGGFAGVAAIKQLVKYLDTKEFQITLVDKNAYHLFTPSLYEVATSESPQQNVAIPFAELFGGKVMFVKGTVSHIDPKAQSVFFHSGHEISYDYLLIAFGSESAFFNIEGLQEYALTLKSLEDAVKIKDIIKESCCKGDECNKKMHVVIGGGGFAGTELAAELLTYKNRLAKQFHLAKDCLEVSVIQGSDRLLKELDPHVSSIAQKRMRSPQMRFLFGGHIKKVTEKKVFTDNGKSYDYDLLIWTGGVTANHIAAKSKLPVNKHGGILVNDFLQVEGLPNIFASGDIASFTDPKTNNPIPQVAQVAEDQGKIAGENIYNVLKGTSLSTYHFQHWGYIVPLKGKFAAAELMGYLHFDGFFGWVLQQLVFLRYLLGILPLTKAFKRWNTFEEQLEK